MKLVDKLLNLIRRQFKSGAVSRAELIGLSSRVNDNIISKIALSPDQRIVRSDGKIVPVILVVRGDDVVKGADQYWHIPYDSTCYKTPDEAKTQYERLCQDGYTEKGWGRGGPNFAVKVRNVPDEPAVFLASSRGDLNASIDSAALAFGFQPSVNEGDGCGYFLSEEFYLGLLPEIYHESVRRWPEDYTKILRQIFDELPGPEYAWDLLEVLNACADANNKLPCSYMEAILGLPNSEKSQLSVEMLKRQVRLMNHMGDVLDSVERPAFFERLREELPEHNDVINEFERHVRNHSAAEAVGNSVFCMYAGRARLSRDGKLDVEPWWEIITVSLLERIFTMSEPEKASFKVHAINSVVGEFKNNMQPLVGRSAIGFGFSMDCQKAHVRVLKGGRVLEDGIFIDEQYEYQADEKDSKSFKITFEAYTDGITKPVRKSHSLLMLDTAIAGCFVSVSDSDLLVLKKASEFLPSRKNAKSSFVSKISVTKETSIVLGIYTGSHFRLKKESVNANYEGEEKTIPLLVEDYDNFYGVRCDVRDGMTVTFSGFVNGKSCSYTVAIDVDQKVDTSFNTVFSHLVECHLNNAGLGASVSFNSSTISSKISQDHIIAAKEDTYYRTGYPVLIADDIGSYNNNVWTGSYDKATKKICVPIDPRPDITAWEAALKLPEAETYFSSRKAFFRAISDSDIGLGGGVVEEYELFRLSAKDNAKLFKLLYEYVAAYANWLEADYQHAVVIDTVWVYLTKGNSLGERPDIILLPPEHPIRIFWHFQAQRNMYDLLSMDKKSNIVASFDSHTIPDVLRMPLLNATTGKVVEVPFFAIPSSSDYWGVYHSYNPKLESADLEDSLFFDNWGFEVTSLKRTMTAGEVESAIKATQSVCIAKDALNVRYIAKNLGGNAAKLLLRQGVSFLNGKDDSGPMFGPRLVSIVGPQASNNPEGVTEAEIMSAREHTEGRLQWYTESQSDDNPVKVDVTIASLGASDIAPYSMSEPRSFGVIAAGGLLRYRNRCRGIVSACEIVESRVSHVSADVAADDVDNVLLHLLELIEGERRFPKMMAGHIHFNADLVGSGILRAADNSSHYYAISSSDVDQSCFEGMNGNEDVYLWEYRLPAPGTHSTGTDGFYLLAKENSTMIQAVSEAVKSLHPEGTNDEAVRQMLFLSAKRGIPTVKNLASGGKSAFGEVGVLVTLDMLQGSILDNAAAGTLPAHVVSEGGEFFNLLVPMDVFRERFDSVVKDVLGERNPTRPDVVVFSIKCKTVDNQLTPIRMRLSFVEVKTRREKMSEIEMEDALKQSAFFRELFSVNNSSITTLSKWSRQDFLVGMLTFGFRVYESIPTLLKPLVALYPRVIAALFENADFLEVNPLPRLAVIHKIPHSKLSMEVGGVYRTVEISKEDAYRIAIGDSVPASLGNIGFWGLLAEGAMSDCAGGAEVQMTPTSQSEVFQENPESEQETCSPHDGAEKTYEGHNTVERVVHEQLKVSSAPRVDLEEKYAAVLQAIKEAFEDFNIDTKRIGEPIETPNFVLIDYKGTPTCTVAKVNSKKEVFLTTHCVKLHRVEPRIGCVRLVLEREQREILYADEVWSRYGYDNKSAIENGLLVAVQEDTGEAVYLNPMGPSAPHTLVAGETGSGKSVLMNNMLYCLKDRFYKGSVKVVIMDPKQVEFMNFTDVPGFTVVTDKGKAIEEFKKLVEEMKRRYEIFKKYKCKKFSQLAEIPGAEKLPIIWCFHDEFAEWFRDDQYKESVVNDVNSLGAMARAAGIFLVFATQRPEANIMPPELRSNLGNRLVLKVADSGTSSIALGNATSFGAANELLGNGHMIMVSGAMKVYCQVPNIKE